MNTILVFDDEKKQEMIDLGFEYVFDCINGKKIPAFFITDELMKYANKNFSNTDFLLNSGIRF